MNDFGLYVIISEPLLPYRKIAEICVAEKISLLQLREKELTDDEILTAGKEILEVTRGTDTNLIINDRPDLAKQIRADGYHLGQDDIHLEEARKTFPGAFVTGLSTHNISQVHSASAVKPDYIGFGPVYRTPTKKIPDPVTGLERLKEVLSFADIPVVAIGGIDENNIEEVLQAGAKNLAMVRYFMQFNDFKERIGTIKSICNDYWRKDDSKTICRTE